MLNLLVAESTKLVIPKPFGPKNASGSDLMELNIADKLSGFTIHFVDDWNTYHLREGEVHCGTNAKRLPIMQNWWQ